VALAAAGFGLNCAGAPRSAGTDRAAPEPVDPAVAAAERAAEAEYRQAEAALAAGDYVVADSLAGHLIAAYSETRWLGPGVLVAAKAALELDAPEAARERAARYLRLYRASDPARTPGLLVVAQTLYLEGAILEAADTLLATPTDLRSHRGDAAQLARQVVSELGLGELDSVTVRWPANHPLQSVFEVERASLLLAAGRAETAREVAGAVLGMDPLEPERNRAAGIESGAVEEEQWRPVIGAILPLSGPLATYGRLAEEGIRLAIEDYNKRHLDDVTLVVRDDADQDSRAAQLIRELERLDAVAVVGPLRAEGLEAAADGRRDRDLLIVSPTALENTSFARNTYSLWSTTERVTREARALAVFALRDLHIRRFGVLYPSNPEGRAQSAAFADAVRARGGEVAELVAYDDTATTFEGPLTALRQVQPQAIYAPAVSWRTVIQLSPQFSYYGLRGVQVLGDADWSAPEVLRMVEPRFIDGTIISTFLDRSSPAVRWPDFVEKYERKYRKGLQESLVPALAYDATNLILYALPWGYPRRSAVARSFREIRSLPGATGVFTVEAQAVTRRPFLLTFRERELVPAFEDLRRERVTYERDGNR
jgi:branched-chain amino acid transport system substrate-binding protein